MKKKIFIFVLILILILCFVLSACAKPYHFEAIDDNVALPRIFKLYVCGAVENEGFVEVFEGTTIDSVLAMAGTIPQTVYPNNSQRLVTEDDDALYVRYFNGVAYCDCLNLNSAQILYRFPAENVDADVIDKIADYLELNGKITNKKLLEDILGDDYQDNYYKFYVDVNDYEEAS